MSIHYQDLFDPDPALDRSPQSWAEQSAELDERARERARALRSVSSVEDMTLPYIAVERVRPARQRQLARAAEREVRRHRKTPLWEWAFMFGVVVIVAAWICALAVLLYAVTA